MSLLRRALWGLLLVVAAGCRSEPPPDGITVLVEAPPDSLDGRFALTAIGQRMVQLIAPGLLTFDDTSRPVPELAESFRALSPTLVEFTLRPGLTFHDGTALTSEDVKATYDGVRSKALQSPKVDRYAPVEEVEVVDDRTVRFHLRGAYAPLLAELSLSIIPAERAGLDGVALQASHPVGAGAFRFESQPDEEHLTLVPFEGYHLGPPAIPRLYFRVVRDETTRVLELLKGRADLVTNAVSPAVLPLLRKQPGLRVLVRPGTGYAYLGFNLRPGPLADVRVRQAVCHLLEVKPLAEHKFHGLAEPATSMIPATHWAYTPGEGCRYNPAEAARLLDEAGYGDPDGPGGLPRLRLSLKVSTDRFRKSVALVLQEQLARGGIAVEVRSLEFGTLFNDIRRGNFEMVTLKWASVIEPDLMRNVYHSSNVPTEENHWGGLNRGALMDPELDALLEEASQVELSERKAAYARVGARLEELLPYAPLWHESSVAVVSRRLEGFEPSAHNFISSLARARKVGP
ncbi:ABC transporter substrate-binding protein [Hyalangium sp.]|uniref:ABC transporter substrate-binding protein n=1 Tax=Hyalangium sp. TaxID=2028555 RepID=UPI002D3E2518|nr:ABC transporter substrate-binding protein [Hyalangium sp.]HYH98808.1 ABC transporter substrate-binding protein [Hyalangium sp.]